MSGVLTRRVAALGVLATVAVGLGPMATSTAHAATAPVFLARYPGHFVTVEYQVPNAKWQTAVTNTIAEWNQSSNVHLTQYPSPRVSDGTSCVPDARSIRICVGNFGKHKSSSDAGLPVVSPSSATNVYRTSGASVMLNTNLGDYAGSPAWLACSEIGFALGLATRSGEKGTCMNGQGMWAEWLNYTPASTPNANDIALLNQLYTNP